MDTDFNGRTVLKIICDGEFMPLLDQNNAMAEALIIRMWDGYESPLCDGNIYGFSNMMHILISKGTKSTNVFSEICMKQFKPNVDDDYIFQYRYRSKAVSYFFWKEFVFGAIMVYHLTQVNLEYGLLFKAPLTYIKMGTDDW